MNVESAKQDLQPHEVGYHDGFYRMPYNNEFEEGSHEHHQYHEAYHQGSRYF